MSATNLKVTRSSADASSGGQQFDMTMLLSVLLLVMALLQVVSFSAFKDWVGSIGFSGEAGWAAVIIIAEVLAAVGFLRVALPSAAKMLAWICAVLVSGFWFIENLRLVADNSTAQLSNSGFFGKYLMQTPGWWTVVEVTILLFWTLYALGYSQESHAE